MKTLEQKFYEISPQIARDAFMHNELTAILQNRIFGRYNFVDQCDNCSADYRSSSSTGPSQTDNQLYNSKKERMVWSQELHEKFENVVAGLGGPQNATPTMILKQMNVERLTLGHIKSHLQKYRHKQQLVKSGFNVHVKKEKSNC
eukprot:TRINITY_DN4647_c2_g1_i3.p2 TRINITY_DN4647_c2_g1~~TRINITY_DN4647_c2_g1_i3.p2  ORF type:complete len:145 (-),score=10.52 TRINITY_DN4647_c2_g1_i3:157-591(-)